MLYYTEEEIRQSIISKPEVAQQLVKQTFLDKKSGLAGFGQEVALIPETLAEGAFYSLPAYLKRQNIAGIKWTNHLAKNRHTNRSYTTPTILLNALDTGERLAILEGLTISGLRTGAVSAVALTYLQVQDCQKILCCGAGFQAYYQLLASIPVLKELKEVAIWSRKRASARRLIHRLQSDFPEVTFRALEELPESLSDFQVVIGVTSSNEPYLKGSQFVAGQVYLHVGMNDIDPNTLTSFDRIICDDVHAGIATSSQSLFRAIRADKLAAADLYLLENVIAGELVLQPASKQITMFNAFGLAIFDLILADAVLTNNNNRKWEESNGGTIAGSE